MRDAGVSRRTFVKQSVVAGPALLTASLPLPSPSTRPLNIVCVGGHPDDPESGCGGALIR